MLKDFKLYNRQINQFEVSKKVLITTLNAFCYNLTRNDMLYTKALKESDILLPDGIGIVLAMRILTGTKLKKIAGEDFFLYELNRLNTLKGKCFFLGSNEKTLELIKRRVESEYPNISISSYSPPYKSEFNDFETRLMLQTINRETPDVLFIGMTAPKQEKWAYLNFKDINALHICCIGAVFNYYAGTIKRAPKWMIVIGFEWFYRLIKEPRRMWKRYLIGNTKFIYYVIVELFSGKKIKF